MGLGIKGGVDVRVVGLAVLALDGEGGYAVLVNERGCHIVLRAERVAGADNGFGAAVLQREQQVGGLTGYMQAGRYAQACERLFLCEALADLAQHGHFARRPVDAADAVGCK